MYNQSLNLICDNYLFLPLKYLVFTNYKHQIHTIPVVTVSQAKWKMYTSSITQKIHVIRINLLYYYTCIQAKRTETTFILKDKAPFNKYRCEIHHEAYTCAYKRQKKKQENEQIVYSM